MNTVLRNYITVIWLMLSCLLCQCETVAPTYTFSYTEASTSIYQDIIDLKLESAKTKLAQQRQAEPYNLSYLHLQSYLDFFVVFITEDRRYFDQSQVLKKDILSALENQLPDTNPYKRFALAEVQLHSAINRSKFGQMLKSAKEILAAYRLLKENEALFPDFILNKKSLSVIHTLAETVSIPSVVKKIFGIEGTMQEGIQEIESLIKYSQEQENMLFCEEIDAIYLYILMYQANDTETALSYLPTSRLQPENSLLSTFMVTKIYQKLGANDLALATLMNRPKGPDYATFQYLDLMEGVCRLRQLDPQCTIFLERYIETFDGIHYKKEAQQKLAWSKLIFDEDLAAYKYHIGQTLEGPNALVDDDKQAERECRSHLIPNKDLLTARLLSDGGYHEKAYAFLVQKAYQFSQNGTHYLEFNYRMGRICQALKNYPEALEYYQNTIILGANEPAYFACNAALQAGLIYEDIKAYKQARSMYQTCLDLKPEDYRSSLHQKAKTGLSRLKAYF